MSAPMTPSVSEAQALVNQKLAAIDTAEKACCALIAEKDLLAASSTSFPIGSAERKRMVESIQALQAQVGDANAEISTLKKAHQVAFAVLAQATTESNEASAKVLDGKLRKIHASVDESCLQMAHSLAKAGRKMRALAAEAAGLRGRAVPAQIHGLDLYELGAPGAVGQEFHIARAAPSMAARRQALEVAAMKLATGKISEPEVLKLLTGEGS
jgi:hypothetical protein